MIPTLTTTAMLLIPPRLPPTLFTSSFARSRTFLPKQRAQINCTRLSFRVANQPPACYQHAAPVHAAAITRLRIAPPAARSSSCRAESTRTASRLHHPPSLLPSLLPPPPVVLVLAVALTALLLQLLLLVVIFAAAAALVGGCGGWSGIPGRRRGSWGWGGPS